MRMLLFILIGSWRWCVDHGLLSRRCLIDHGLWSLRGNRGVRLANRWQWWKLLPVLGISNVSPHRLHRAVLSTDGSMSQMCNGHHIIALGHCVGPGFGKEHQRSRRLGYVTLGLLQTCLDVAQLSQEIEVEAVGVRGRRLLRFGIREDISNGIISCRLGRGLGRRGNGSCNFFGGNKCSRVSEDRKSGETTLG